MAGSYLLCDIDDESLKAFSDLLYSTRVGNFTLRIASGGGETDAMWAFVDMIMCSKRNIVGIASGTCHSAAPLILASCDERYCTPNTQFMVHEDIVELEGAPSTTIKKLARAQDSEDRWYTAMSLATGTTINEWRRLSEAETYFDANEALRLGIVDSIMPILKGNKK